MVRQGAHDSLRNVGVEDLRAQRPYHRVELAKWRQIARLARRPRLGILGLRVVHDDINLPADGTSDS